VAAALVVAFIDWGTLSTHTLSAVGTAVLAGVMNAGGWAFVLLDRLGGLIHEYQQVA
jgi:hypothetical protein